MSLKSLYLNTLIIASLFLFSFGVETAAKTPSAALTGVTVSIPTNLSGANNTIISVPVTLSNPNAKSISGFALDFTYNPQILQPLGPDTDPGPPAVDRTGTLSASCGGAAQATGPNTGSTSNTFGVAFGNCAITGSGTLVNIRFRIVGTAGQTTQLTVSPRSFENPQGGTVVATAPAPGNASTITVATSPSAASVNIGGRVMGASGRGLLNAQVRLILADGSTRTAATSSFGFYRFNDVQAGQTVTLQIVSKRYTFQPQTVTVTGEITDLNFVAER